MSRRISRRSKLPSDVTVDGYSYLQDNPAPKPRRTESSRRQPATTSSALLPFVIGVVVLVVGFYADEIASRYPAHHASSAMPARAQRLRAPPLRIAPAPAGDSHRTARPPVPKDTPASRQRTCRSPPAPTPDADRRRRRTGGSPGRAGPSRRSQRAWRPAADRSGAISVANPTRQGKPISE